MNRKAFLKATSLIPFAIGGISMNLNALTKIVGDFENTELMPVLFVGHGSPMNAIEDNPFSKEMKAIGKKLPKPNAILMVSAHWETKGTFVTAQENPKTIHDFGGFPKALFEAQYPAPGSKWLASETKNAITKTSIGFDESWGYDHGCWSVLKNMFPQADIPVIQLSLDYTKEAQYHYELSKQLQSLRSKGVLIIGSGNIVHNFQYAQLKGMDFNEPFGHAWALEANETFKKLIEKGDHQPLIHYSSIGKFAQLAVPTPEHYLPMLYAIALQEKNESVRFFNDTTIAGSFSMTSFLIQKGW